MGYYYPPMQLHELYFYTATIYKHQKLLKPDKFKEIILDSLRYLTRRGKIAVYGFVLMPNHIHLLWEMRAKNGKEMPYASFMKFTAHAFLKELRKNHPHILPYFDFDDASRRHMFWERQSMPKRLFAKNIFLQKLHYTHNNPLQPHWQLAQEAHEYAYSSARFYKDGTRDFGFLQHYQSRIAPLQDYWEG